MSKLDQRLTALEHRQPDRGFLVFYGSPDPNQPAWTPEDERLMARKQAAGYTVYRVEYGPWRSGEGNTEA